MESYTDFLDLHLRFVYFFRNERLCHLLSLVVIRCRSLSLDVSFVCLFINDPDRYNDYKNILPTSKLTDNLSCWMLSLT